MSYDNCIDSYDLLNKRVVVVNTGRKKSYKNTLHMTGTVIRASSGSLGVMLDDLVNQSSSYGCFWFNTTEVEKIVEDDNMEGFKNVAIVNLLEDYNKKEYGFALYETEYIGLGIGDLVVVNPRGKDNRVLATVKDIKTIDEYGKDVSAQIVGVVNMSGFTVREAERKRKEEIKKERAAIEKELESKVRKLKDMEFYEKMAKEYSEKDPELMELVEKLKSLEE